MHHHRLVTKMECMTETYLIFSLMNALNEKS